METIAITIMKYLNKSEAFIFETIRNINGFETIILTNKKSNLDQFPHNKVYSISDLSDKEIRKNKIYSIFGAALYFEKILVKNNAGLIHAQFAWDGIRMLKTKRKLKLPLITNFRGMDIFRNSRSWLYRLQLKKLFKAGDLFLPVSDHIRRFAIEKLGCPKDKILTLYGGIDLNKFSFAEKNKIKDHKIIILMCGRIAEKKGFEYGLKAFSLLKKTNKNAELHIVGEASLLCKFRDIAKNLLIKNSVVFAGGKTHQETADYMKKADILLAPYVTPKNGDQEGIPNVVKEAMATGLPVVSTIHGGVPEIIIDKKTGLLVKEKDVEGLYKCLTTLINDPNLRYRLANAGRKFIEENFDVIKQTKKLEEIYRKILNARN